VKRQSNRSEEAVKQQREDRISEMRIQECSSEETGEQEGRSEEMFGQK
jgi:DNA-binding CsgD family transcriptional regulator